MTSSDSTPELGSELEQIQNVLAGIDDPLPLLAGFFAHAPVAFQVYGADGHSLLVNAAFRRLFGSVPPPEYNVLQDEIAARAGVLDQIRRAFGGEIIHTPPVWYDARELQQVQVAEGNRIAIEATFFPLRNARGEVEHVAIAFRDVTVEQTAAESTRAEQARLQLLADASAVLGSSLDVLTTIRQAARLTVPRLADVCTVDVLEGGQLRRVALAHADPAREQELRSVTAQYEPGWEREHPVGEVVRTGRRMVAMTVPDELVARIENGEPHLALARASGISSYLLFPLKARGTILGVISFMYAGSARQYSAADVPLGEEVARRVAHAIDNAQLYGQAQEAVRARDEFLSIASHELRTPVAGISAASQLLRRRRDRGQLDEGRLEQVLATVERSASHLARLTEDLLDVSRLQQGLLPLRLQEVNVAELLRVVATEQQVSRPVPAIELDITCASCVVDADPDRLEQVIANLLDNAAKYSPGGEPVHVTLERTDDGVRLQVCDSGIGLPAEAIQRIFEPFGRAANAQRQNIPGLGLGLYIGRRIARQHGGDLWAHSEGEGHGTVFTLVLKRHVDQTAVGHRTSGPG